jgi:hypothetical protein
MIFSSRTMGSLSRTIQKSFRMMDFHYSHAPSHGIIALTDEAITPKDGIP